MISKPEWFKGEVKSFEGEINKLMNSICHNTTPFIERLLEFYLQSFTLKLITKLFEGWSGDERNLYKGNEVHILIYPLANYIIIGHYKFPIPKTLNQFITYCDAANIPLIWKSGE